jgi:rod shape-determining protein MreD
MSLCVVFVILQTTLFPSLPGFTAFFDLFLPVVIYMGLFRSVKQSILPLLFQGVVMDSLSGAPFGIYTSCYIWLFVAVYWFKGFLHIKSHLLLALIVCASVLIQHAVLVISNDMPVSDWNLFAETVGILSIQMILAMIIGPLMILWIQNFYEKWQRLTDRFSSD